MNALGSNARRQPRRIACIEFEPDEINSLRSLLGLLDPYLKHAWEVGDLAQADVVLVRCDAENTPMALPGGTTVVGCARRPRQLASPAIHRPLRASEILAVLNDGGETASATGTEPGATPAPSTEAWRLSYWPLDFESFPPPWRRVLAALAARAMTREDLVHCTRLAMDDVSHCLQRLRDAGALTGTRKPSLSPAPPAARWRHLIAGIGRKLGFPH